MEDYNIGVNEVVLLEDSVTYSECKGTLQLTLTSQKIIIEKDEEKGFFKKQKPKVFLDVIPLDSIKMYNDKIQIKQKNSEVIFKLLLRMLKSHLIVCSKQISL